jgi:hypothetical protein
MDRLPPPIRAALHEGVVDWDPLVLRWQLNKLLAAGVTEGKAVETVVAWVRDWDRQEVKLFAHHWPARFGRYTPHVNAGATILRYGDRGRCA